MSRYPTCILLFLTLASLAYGSEYHSIPLSQSHLNLRNLGSADSSSQSETDSFIRYKNNFAVSVNLGEEYTTRNNLTSQNQTDMIVLLYTNITSFCKHCQQFVSYNCESNTCQEDSTIDQSFLAPFYDYKKAHPIKQNLTIGNSTKNSWKLSTNATLFDWSQEPQMSIYTTYAKYELYVSAKGTYGFIGLGVGGDAFSNFRGDHPLFSIYMNSTGQGQLIFGKNTSLYNTSSPPVVLTTDTNWTMMTQSMTFGDKYSNDTFVSKLIFDLQYPGIGIPTTYWDDSWNAGKNFKDIMEKQYKIKINSSYALDGYWYTYYGNLTDLPDITIGLTNEKSISIPPAAYTRKHPTANDTWVLLISYVTKVNGEKFTTDRDKYVNHTVIGWPVMSYFYTVFEQKKGSDPTITLYKAIVPSWKPSENTPISGLVGVIILAALVVLAAVGWAYSRKRAASKLETELGEELKHTHLLQEH